MASLSEWLEIMLDEIARKRDEQLAARTEDSAREAEERKVATSTPPKRERA